MIKGAIVAIVTPFKNGQIDEEALRELIEFQIANGTDGIVPCGTTGESPVLSHEEHDRVIEITVDAVKKRVPVIAGTGSNSTEEALRLTRHAYEVGADAALMVCPYYNRPTQEGLYQHYKFIAENVPLPIIIYNIPGRTGVNLLPETLARLAEIPNIVGTKEASGSLKQMHDVIAKCGPDFSVLSGDDFFTYPLMCLGGHGIISVISNVAPADMAAMVDAFEAGDYQKAKELHFKMVPLVDMLFIETNPVPVKAALAMMGKIEYEVRLPLCKLSAGNYEKLKKAMTDYGLIK
ncbi:MAG TPA: 4-hydroxy-tetrahydrodipicolinate synthase [Syntrophales bacterium]|nr:4-hydroxy-tetrahydrodipicolinate synthase [Syntrophales bacterium]HOM07357.1 4-hydroxy-tetrahydrodipicolinate synthase [Syntrophales bacterium]HON98938.1 4-hydroxy-tetrahydrodipicolinate synthase [Syntrophales bacterium]HPC00402.1 4-hydroxy-tetrahydrodipicolinate synthase [Syntrophales bacterium]HPQ07005.1 4-hydroxy-tetrahydrodipicolinate synthase [Syntrophales bacterium]